MTTCLQLIEYHSGKVVYYTPCFLKKGPLTFRAIISLRQEMEHHAILTLGKNTKLARRFLQDLYGKPITDSQETARQLSINPSTALRLIEDFIQLGILKEITGYKRNRVFVFERYLKLFE